MAMSRPDLVAILSFVADEVEAGRGSHYAGAIRVAARRLVELERQAAEADRSATGCGWCGAPLEQPATGRRRRYCSDACRRRAGGNGGKSMLGVEVIHVGSDRA